MVLALMHPLRCTRWAIQPSLLFIYSIAIGQLSMHLGQGCLLYFDSIASKWL